MSIAVLSDRDLVPSHRSASNGFRIGAHPAPGITWTDVDPQADRERSALMNFIALIARTTVPPVDSLTAATARLLVSNLPRDRACPQVAGDGEGGLMLVWGGNFPSLLITIDGMNLYPVIHPGTDTSRHIDAIQYRDSCLSHELIEAIPHC